ncbi:hypothetical protein MHBO_001618 [Bonamia ostreae]|uniref:Zinc finger C2H2 LYAR-type domain-containing protein n=1 Tax=Bonamia ostreae TaxID=126728 RepID=A0ABV2AJM1_9EUKA
MVSFVCDKCQSTLKKKTATKHMRRCKSKNVSCLDCQKEFNSKNIKTHISCITEDQKFKVTKKTIHEKAEKSYQQKMQIKSKKDDLEKNEKTDKIKNKKIKKIGNEKDLTNEPLKIDGKDNIPDKGPNRITSLQTVMLSELSNHSNGISLKKFLKNYLKRINGENKEKEKVENSKNELWTILLKSSQMIKLRLN